MVTNFKNVELPEEQIKKFREQETKANCIDDFCKLAENISRRSEIFKNTKDSEDIYKIVEALEASIDSPDSVVAKKRFDELIDSFPEEEEYNTLHDLFEKEWLSRIYQKAESLAETYDEYKRLATSIEGYLDNDLDNNKLLRKIYKKVERLAETFEEHESLAKSIEDNLDDEEWVKKLRKEVQKLKAQARS